ETGAGVGVLEREEHRCPAVLAAQLRDLALDPDGRQARQPGRDPRVECTDGEDLPPFHQRRLDLHESRIEGRADLEIHPIVIWKFGDQGCTNELLSEGRVFPTGTVTMLFTDIEGSTRLLKQLGKDYGALLDDHRRLLREAFAAHDGREMDTQG